MEPLVQTFQNEINAVIDKFKDEGLTVAECIGALELSKLSCWYEQQDNLL